MQGLWGWVNTVLASASSQLGHSELAETLESAEMWPAMNRPCCCWTASEKLMSSFSSSSRLLRTLLSVKLATRCYRWWATFPTLQFQGTAPKETAFNWFKSITCSVSMYMAVITRSISMYMAVITHSISMHMAVSSSPTSSWTVDLSELLVFKLRKR